MGMTRQPWDAKYATSFGPRFRRLFKIMNEYLVKLTSLSAKSSMVSDAGDVIARNSSGTASFRGSVWVSKKP